MVWLDVLVDDVLAVDGLDDLRHGDGRAQEGPELDRPMANQRVERLVSQILEHQGGAVISRLDAKGPNDGRAIEQLEDGMLVAKPGELDGVRAITVWDLEDHRPEVGDAVPAKEHGLGRFVEAGRDAVRSEDWTSTTLSSFQHARSRRIAWHAAAGPREATAGALAVYISGQWRFPCVPPDRGSGIRSSPWGGCWPARRRLPPVPRRVAGGNVGSGGAGAAAGSGGSSSSGGNPGNGRNTRTGDGGLGHGSIDHGKQRWRVGGPRRRRREAPGTVEGEPRPAAAAEAGWPAAAEAARRAAAGVGRRPAAPASRSRGSTARHTRHSPQQQAGHWLRRPSIRSRAEEGPRWPGGAAI